MDAAGVREGRGDPRRQGPAPAAAGLEMALRVQSALAAGLMAAFCAAALAGVAFGIGAQVAVLLAGIVLVGFPHGAFDHLVARPVLRPRLGRHWWAPFGLGYLALAGLVWLAWLAAPAVNLAGFLAASVLHFGLGDVEDGLAPRRMPAAVPVLAYGALPILLPMALHPADAAPVLAALADVPVGAMQDTLGLAIWLLVPWCIAFVIVVLAAVRERRGVAERLAMAAGFVLLPPLLAFGIYFGAGHAVRHLLRLGAWHRGPPRAAARWMAWTMLPAAAACAMGIAGLAWLGRDAAADVLAPLFRVIAALTLPHMVVTAWLDTQQARDVRSDPVLAAGAAPLP